MKSKIILASLAILGSIELSAYTYEVNPLVGKNFTESGSLVDDSTAFGIRVNRYISENNALMFGYTRINGADYKRGANSSKNTKSARSCGIDPCAKPAPTACPTGCDKPAPKPCPTGSGCGTGNGANNGAGNGNGANNGAGNGNGANNGAGNGNGANNGAGNGNGANNGAGNGNGANNGAGNGNGANNGAGNGNGNGGAGNGNGGTTGNGTGTVVPTPGKGISNLANSYASDTDINRFYINGLHNITTRYNRLTPYVYGGFGYEHVSNELKDNDSQGFFNAGGGLKFNINDRFNVLADVQGIKKFSNHDLDILGSIGIGYLFGQAMQPQPEAVVDSGLADVAPIAEPQRNITVVEVTPQAVAVAPIIEDAPMGEYYVQMAAGFKTDMETGCKHTRDLRDAGINYDVKYMTIRGKNAAVVVVGPYETKQEAKSHLTELRVYSKDAFIRRIKN